MYSVKMNGKGINWGTSKAYQQGSEYKSLTVSIPADLVKAKQLKDGEKMTFKTSAEGTIYIELNRGVELK